LIDDVLAMLAQEKIVTRREAGRIILSAHSGGYRPLAFALERGGMASKVALLFLFDALYAEHDFFRHWITSQPGIIRAAYTEHLAGEHRDFLNSLAEEPRKRFLCGPTTVPHDEVVQAFFSTWLRELPEEWKTTRP
jgi:hypothetical protein